MSLMFDVAASDNIAALSPGRSRFIDIFRKKPHLPPFEEELAVMPVELGTSIGELIRPALLLLVILARRDEDAGGRGMASDSARVVRKGGVGIARSASGKLLKSDPADFIRRTSGCEEEIGVKGDGALSGAD